MAKQIIFNYDDKDYTLEFTRRTVEEMENEGFNANDISARPMTMVPQLFAGAFKAHHRFVKKETTDKIYAAMPDKETLLLKLVEMYNDPIATLMDEPDEQSKNVEWAASW